MSSSADRPRVPPSPVATLRGLGPRSAAALAAVGIADADALRRADPFAVWARLKARDPATGLNFLYALIGAVEDRDWRDVARRDRTSVLLRLDAMGLAPRRAATRCGITARG